MILQISEGNMDNKEMRVALYARCSTHDKGQNPEVQLSPLREFCKARGWSCVGEFVDNGFSGAKDKRPQLDKLMNLAKKRQVDCIVVWKLDRWGRSLKHLVNSLSELQSLGVSFVSYSENIDLSTAAGTMMFHVIGAMCQFERSLCQDRIRAGMSLAVAKGVRIGRTPTPSTVIAKVISVYEAKKAGVRDISKNCGVPRSTVFRILKDYKAGKIDRNGLPVTSK
jgi:DNA invertase Pin-like site-specific DNA recombinase